MVAAMNYTWIAYDPNRSYFGHPYLPTGYDSADIGGDEVNGPGVNWPIWPELFDTFVSFEAMFITDSMMNFFATGCPDLKIPHDTWEVLLPHEERTQIIRTDWVGQMLPSQNNVLRFPQEVRKQEVRKRA